VLYLLADRMRNAGKFTVADVLSYRLRRRPVRVAAAINALLICGIYLTAQLVGAGSLIEALAGISFMPAVLICGIFMVVYVVFGGMLATTWVQIIKAGLLMIAGTVLTILVLAKVNFDVVSLFDRAAAANDNSKAYISGGLQHPDTINGISFGLALLLGTAGLPHLLMRFFTVPDARAARRSIGWAVALIGAFFIMTLLVGVGARAILGAGAVEASAGGNLATPMLAEKLGGGQGTVGGDLFLAIISAVAFATILAVVAGLVIAASGAVAHDVWTGVVRQGRTDEHEEVRVARTASIGLGVLAIIVSILAGPNFNVSVLVGLAFAVAASCNLPALLLALFWPRFNTTGAVAGVLGGLIVAVVIIGLSPPVWPGPDSQGSPVSLRNPAIISIPAGFLCCWLGTMLSREGATARSYHELHVRAETGIGAF
jgi:cation/acetate symporter